MLLSDFRPRAKLVTQVTQVARPRFPAIDAHNHLAAPFGGGWDRQPIGELLARLDEADVRVVVDLDGGGGEDILDAHLRHFFIRYADRILFGADAGPDLADYQLYYRFLETDDEYFNYNGGAVPRQGRWGAYGLYLPDDVLEKVYWRNAARLLRVA